MTHAEELHREVLLGIAGRSTDEAARAADELRNLAADAEALAEASRAVCDHQHLGTEQNRRDYARALSRLRAAVARYRGEK